MELKRHSKKYVIVLASSSWVFLSCLWRVGGGRKEGVGDEEGVERWENWERSEERDGLLGRGGKRGEGGGRRRREKGSVEGDGDEGEGLLGREREGRREKGSVHGGR
ncbi:hypothetical protein Pmani_028233 [Petrolisthes manimaculis]|uniref:Uncharacterized protein n=1 Tax=Petrolisthes manimaculis TaxID=1843537 RepID=A0AAE1P1W1_9EUCA|nr:hypothetical protein Pmani_028233 [Petrolisthes manimaculis]